MSYTWIHHQRGTSEAIGGPCQTMSKIGWGLVLLVRAITLGRWVLTRNAVPARAYSTGRYDKSPFLFRLISCCSERSRRTSVLLSNNTPNTLAFRQFLLRRYCCKNQVEDEEMSATKREPAAEQLTEYKKYSKVKSQSCMVVVNV